MAPLRLEARTLQGPGRKQAEESPEAAQLRSVTVRTAGDRGCARLAEPLANPQLAGSPRLVMSQPSRLPACPPGVPSRRALCLVSAGSVPFLPVSRTPAWPRVLLHRLFPDFYSLTSLWIHSTRSGFPQLCRDLASSSFYSPPSGDCCGLLECLAHALLICTR